MREEKKKKIGRCISPYVTKLREKREWKTSEIFLAENIIDLFFFSFRTQTGGISLFLFRMRENAQFNLKPGWG